MSFEMKKEKNGNIVNFTAIGRIVPESVGKFQKPLEDAVDMGQINIILDMEQVAYLNSNGIRAILKTYKETLKDGGSFYIKNPSQMVKSVLGMAALEQMLLK